MHTWVALWLVLLPLSARAQSVDSVVHGTVRYAGGSVAAGAIVTLTNAETMIVRVTTSDGSGAYRLPPVAPGPYDIEATLPGFAPQRRPGVVLHVGGTLQLDFTFERVATAGRVDVVGRGPMLQTTTNALSRLVTRDELDLLPVPDRNFNALAILAPGVTATGTYGGVDVSGSRDFQNGYTVDGVSIEALGAGEQRIRFAQDWIQEFQVLTGQYPAEFGRASGGFLNAVTRSGSNRAAGRAYGYFRDEGWDARPAFATTKPSLRSKRFGGTHGGPLRRDRLFYFAGYEWFDDTTGRVVSSSFEALNGTVPVKTDDKVWLLKLDHQRSASSWLRLRYNAERRDSTNVGVGGRGTEEQGLAVRYTAHDLAGTWSRIVGGSAFNELRAAWTETRDRSRCNFAERNPSGPWFTLIFSRAVRGCPGGGFGMKATGELQVMDNISWARGRHDVKAGVFASRGRTHGDYRFVRDGIYRFAGDIPFNIAVPDSYPTSFSLFEGNTAWNVARWTWGVFLQDSWRLTPDLTVNAGLRYDIDRSYTALNRFIRTERGLHTVRPDRDNIAPRGGVVWTPFDNDGRTLLRGGAGLYHDQNHLNVVTLMLFNNVLVDRAVSLNASTPEPPFADRTAVRRFLAEALGRGSVPDFSALPAGVAATPDLDEHLQVPYAAQASGGVSHRFGSSWTASVDAVVSRGLDQYVLRDVNVDRDAALVARPARILRLNPAYSAINQYGNGGRFMYRALQFQARFRPAPEHMLSFAYTLAKTESDTRTALEGAGGGGGATNPFELDEDFGPADHDVRHVVGANWSQPLPFGLQLSGVVAARSATPWSIALEQIDDDALQDRPEPRNSRRGDSYVSVDLRIAKMIRLRSRRSASVFAELFNATNETNLSGHVNSRQSSTFGQASSAFERRRVQLGFRMSF